MVETLTTYNYRHRPILIFTSAVCAVLLRSEQKYQNRDVPQ